MKDKLGNEIHVGDKVASAASDGYNEYHLDVDTVTELITEGDWEYVKFNLENGREWHERACDVVVVKEP